MKIEVELLLSCPDQNSWFKLAEGIRPEHRFMLRSWYTAWASAYLPMDRWTGPISWLIARESSANILGVIPFAHQKWAGFRINSLGGYYWPFRGIPMVVDGKRLPQTCHAMAHFIDSRLRRVWRFGPIARCDRVVAGLLDALLELGWTALEKTLGETYAVTLPTEFGLYEKQLGSHLLKSVAYYERRLSKIGPLKILAVNSNNQQTWLKVLDDLKSLEANSWVAKDVDGLAKFMGSRNRRFWEEVNSTQSLGDALEVWMLYVNRTPTSYSLNINVQPTKYILANGYDEAFKEHSPGTVLAYHVLRDAANRGMASIEWGLGDSGYKRRWHAQANLKLMDIILLPRTAVGKLVGAVLLKSGRYTSWARS